MQKQANGETYPDGTKYYEPHDDDRIIADAISTFTNTSDGQGDTNYEKYTFIKGKAFVGGTTKHWVGDHYNRWGYMKKVEADTNHYDAVPRYQITWTHSTTPPSPTTSPNPQNPAPTPTPGPETSI